MTTHNIECKILCTITNPAAGRPFIIQDSYTITADPALTTASDVGNNSSDMTCVSVDFASFVTPKVFKFKTVVSHCIANVSLPTIAN